VDAASAWLHPVSASGTTGGSSTLQFSLDAAVIATLRNGRYVAQVTVTPSLAGASPVTIPVALTLDRTQVATVAPYVEASGRQAEVFLRGARFDEVTIQSVRFGSVDVPATAPNFQLDGPTRIRVVHPALTAGRYPVSIIVGGSAIDSTAELVVQDPMSYAAAGSGTKPVPNGTIVEFDPERHACYYASMTQVGSLVAGASSWSPKLSPASFTLVNGMALTADGRELLVADSNSIVHLDPVTLAETHRTRLSTTTSTFYTPNLVRVDDGTVAFATLNNVWTYQPWTYASTQINTNSGAAYVLANRTGNQIVLQRNPNATDYAILDSMNYSQQFTFADATFFDTITTDRFGARWAFTRLTSSMNTVLTDGAGTQIGTVPSFDALGSVMSDDGQKLVLFLSLAPTLETYDLSAVAGGGSPVLTGSATPSNFAGAYLTPQQNELVMCGDTAQAVPVP
jgi:hypothetical protein